MKRGKVLMTVLVVMAMLFASCSSNLSEGDTTGGSSSKVVSVSLGVEIMDDDAQKVIDSDTNLDNLTYWYKATPKWHQDRPIHGGTTTDGENYYFVMIPNYTSGSEVSLGYFTAGTWQFDIQVKKGDSVIYEGSTIYSISTIQKSVAITVTPYLSGTGSVEITVKVPTTWHYDNSNQVSSESLAVTYTGHDTPVNVPLASPTPRENNLTTFTTTIDDLTPGAYTFSFQYTDDSGNTVTEGAAQAVNVYKDQTSKISGIIDAGKWHSSSITISTPAFTTFTCSAPEVYVAPGANLEFEANAVSALAGATIVYEFFVNGVSQAAASGTNTFTFKTNTLVNVPVVPPYRMYEVTCVATDTAHKFTASIPNYVEVGYLVSNGTIENGGITPAYGERIFAAGDIVSLTATPTTNTHKLKTLTIEDVDADDIQYDAASGKASFRMPAHNAVINAAFAQLYAIGLPKNVKSGVTGNVKTNESVAGSGDTVILTPATGYTFNNVAPVVKRGDVPLAVTKVDTDKYSFAMPAEAVTVTATVVKP